MCSQNDENIKYKFMMDLILKKDYSAEEAKRVVKELFSEGNSETIQDETITGDFEKALRDLICNIKDKNMSSSDLLYYWDRTRGTDWYTSTRLLKSKQN